MSFLKDGDQIYVGEKNGTVNVYGAVVNEGLFVWQRSKRTKNYIRKSGSYDGKINQIVVRHANGITKKKLGLITQK